MGGTSFDEVSKQVLPRRVGFAGHPGSQSGAIVRSDSVGEPCQQWLRSSRYDLLERARQRSTIKRLSAIRSVALVTFG